MLGKPQRKPDITDVIHVLLGVITHFYVLISPLNAVFIFTLYLIYQYFSYKEKHNSISEDVLEFGIGFIGASLTTLTLSLLTH